jgi:hypothetical protein
MFSNGDQKSLTAEGHPIPWVRLYTVEHFSCNFSEQNQMCTHSNRGRQFGRQCAVKVTILTAPQHFLIDSVSLTVVAYSPRHSGSSKAPQAGCIAL